MQNLTGATAAIIGVGAVEIAYSIGVCVDVAADWLLTAPTRKIRSSVASRVPKNEWSSMHYRVLHRSGGMGSHTDYIRSRMRIVRSLVVIVPAATVVTLAGIAIQYDGSEKIWLLAGLAIAGTGLTLVVLLVWLHISLT